MDPINEFALIVKELQTRMTQYQYSVYSHNISNKRNNFGHEIYFILLIYCWGFQLRTPFPWQTLVPCGVYRTVKHITFVNSRDQSQAKYISCLHHFSGKRIHIFLSHRRCATFTLERAHWIITQCVDIIFGRGTSTENIQKFLAKFESATFSYTSRPNGNDDKPYLKLTWTNK